MKVNKISKKQLELNESIDKHGLLSAETALVNDDLHMLINNEMKRQLKDREKANKASYSRVLK